MEYTERHLTEQDRVRLRAELRKGYIVGFCTLWVVLLASGICYLFEVLPMVVYGLGGLGMLAGLLVGERVSHDVSADLRHGRKHVYVKEIKGVQSCIKKEHMNMLMASMFFRKGLYYSLGYYLTAGNLDYPITEAERDALEGQTHCELHYAPRSFTLLGVHPIEK